MIERVLDVRLSDSRQISYVQKQMRQLQVGLAAILHGESSFAGAADRDSLPPARRRQVDLVKSRYRELRKRQPEVSLLALARKTLEEDRRKGLRGGYTNVRSLRLQAQRELAREELWS